MNLECIFIDDLLLKQYLMEHKTRNHPMKHIPLITLAALLVPISAHAGDPVSIPEPEVLPLLGIGIAVAVAVKFFKKK